MQEEPIMSLASHLKTALVVSPPRDDQLAGCLQEAFRHSIFRDFNWQMLTVQTCRGALELLRENPIPVVISWYDLRDGNWKDLLGQVTLMGHPPTFVVSYPPRGHCFWSEVLHLGGYDVLVEPFDPLDVFRLVTLARQNWNDEEAMHLERFRQAPKAG